MNESGDQIYRIICCKNADYSLTYRGGNVVFALTNPCDRHQHWMKDERHGAEIKDSEGQPAFAVINRATGQAVSHCPKAEAIPLVQYDGNSCDESVLWTMSKDAFEGFRHIRRADLISVIWVARYSVVYDGHIIDLYAPTGDYGNPVLTWKFEKVSPSTCITLFQPSQNTVRIICRVKVDYNLAIDKDGSTVLLVHSNPKDKYQHWTKEMAYGVPVKDEQGQDAFALVNKATGKAIKHGFGNNYLVQVALFDRNYIDPSLLWTESSYGQGSFRQIRMQNNINLVFNIFDEGIGKYPLLGLLEPGTGTTQQWKIEHFE